MYKTALLALTLCAVTLPAHAQDVKSSILKHLNKSKDFTVKVAEAMPEADYDFKLTAPQMSFAQQLVHLSQGFEYFTSPIAGQKPAESKPASMKKADVVAFVKTSFDHMIARVSAMTPDQLSKMYKSEEGEMSGLDLLLGLLDHTTHHRASAEMYLRAKGIKPPEYEF